MSWRVVNGGGSRRREIAVPTVMVAATAATGASFSPCWNARTLDSTGTIPRSTKLVVSAKTKYAAAKAIAVHEKLFGPLALPIPLDW